MAPFLRQVKTASGATAVQVVAKEGRRNRVLERVGSAYSAAELSALMYLGRERLHEGQEVLDLDLTCDAAPSAGVLTMQDRRSRYLLEALQAAWHRLGFEVVDDEAFFQLVAARLIEPTSMSDSRRVLSEVGIDPVHRNTFHAALRERSLQDFPGGVFS